MTKTFSRARTATAALNKIVEAHEMLAFVIEVSSTEVAPGRFAAALKIDGSKIDPTSLAMLTADLDGKFDYSFPPAQIDAPEVENVETFVAEAAAEAAPAPRKSSYINEVSSIVKPTKRVHMIADAMPGASRKDVIAACREQGIAYGTARTQYQVWKQNQK